MASTINAKVSASILFVCSMNMVRSPLAATIARGLFGDRLFVRSAGIQKGQEDPFVRRVLEELDFNKVFSSPKQLDNLGDSFFDLVIVLSQEAKPHVESWIADKAMELEYWPTYDPTQTTGNAAQKLDAYRQTRDQLKAQIEAKFDD